MMNLNFNPEKHCEIVLSIGRNPPAACRSGFTLYSALQHCFVAGQQPISRMPSLMKRRRRRLAEAGTLSPRGVMSASSKLEK